MTGVSDSNVPTKQSSFIGIPLVFRSTLDNEPDKAAKRPSTCAGCIVRKCQARER